MPGLGQQHQLLLRAGILPRHLAFEEAQIEVVGRDRPEVLVPHDLGRDIGIIGIEERKRLPGDVAQQVAMVRGEAHLARVLFGRILVRRRPIDAARRHDVHLHALGDRDEGAGTDQRADLLRILRSDDVACLDLGVKIRRKKNRSGDHQCGSRFDHHRVLSIPSRLFVRTISQRQTVFPRTISGRARTNRRHSTSASCCSYSSFLL